MDAKTQPNNAGSSLGRLGSLYICTQVSRLEEIGSCPDGFLSDEMLMKYSMKVLVDDIKPSIPVERA